MGGGSPICGGVGIPVRQCPIGVRHTIDSGSSHIVRAARTAAKRKPMLIGGSRKNVMTVSESHPTRDAQLRSSGVGRRCMDRGQEGSEDEGGVERVAVEMGLE